MKHLLTIFLCLSLFSACSQKPQKREPPAGMFPEKIGRFQIGSPANDSTPDFTRKDDGTARSREKASFNSNYSIPNQKGTGINYNIREFPSNEDARKALKETNQINTTDKNYKILQETDSRIVAFFDKDIIVELVLGNYVIQFSGDKPIVQEFENSFPYEAYGASKPNQPLVY